MLTALPRSSGRVQVIPFVRLSERPLLTAMRDSGVPLQRIHPALLRLEKDLGLAHALVSKRLYTDDVEAPYDHAERGDDPAASQAAQDAVRNNQRVFNEIIESYLRRLDFADDGSATSPLAGSRDGRRGCRPDTRIWPAHLHSRWTRVADALSLLRAGKLLEVAAQEHGIPPAQLEDAVIEPGVDLRDRRQHGGGSLNGSLACNSVRTCQRTGADRGRFPACARTPAQPRRRHRRGPGARGGLWQPQAGQAARSGSVVPQ